MTTQEDTTAPDAAETPATIQTEAVQADAVKTPSVPEPTFADFNVHPDIVAALAEAGIIHPFPIQSMTLAVALGGHDIIGQAKTGTGKTLGFGIPMIQNVISPKDEEFATLTTAGKPQALAVAPTRELAVQVSGDLERAGKARGVRVVTIYGGRAFEPQVQALQRGVEIVVGTPGRLLDLAKQGHLDLSYVKSVVLDEADEMLDLGFLPDIEKLLAQTPASRQTMLFSATMPGAIVALARRYMTQPTHIRAMGEDQDSKTVKAVEQFVYRAHAMDKVEMLARMLQAKDRGRTLIFSRTKRTTAKVADDLAERGFAAAAIHGDLGQGAREQAMRAFRNGKVDVLVATDVAARGIDVDDVTHVINYQCPEDDKTYLHRIGRTARAGNTGVAVTFVDWDDLHRWGMINKALDLGIPEAAETYSSSEHFYRQMNIPANATGRLPKSSRTRAGLAAEKVEDLGETGKNHRGGPPERGRSSAGHSGGGRSGGPSKRGTHSAEGRERPADRPKADQASSHDRPQSADDTKPRRSRNRRRTRGGQGGAAGAGTAKA
ncbi:MAG: DEAD/DEAH box helicase [Dermatophilaceae bacterium]|nr:DEAD/DEAH box helicase [Dermatophilaceae bacterium]